MGGSAVTASVSITFLIFSVYATRLASTRLASCGRHDPREALREAFIQPYHDMVIRYII